MGRKYSIGSSLRSSYPSIILSPPPLSKISLAVASLLTSPLLHLLWFSLTSGRCFRTWTLITNQFYQLPLFLCSSAPTHVSLPAVVSNFVGMTLPFTLTLTVLLKVNSRLFPLLLLSLLLWH